MKKVLVVLLGIVVISCADPDLEPIVTFDNAGKGAYPRLTASEGEPNINFFDIASSSYTYSVEFVSEAQGNDVASFTLDLEYDPADGSASITVDDWKSYASSTFTTSELGYKSVENIVLASTEMIDAIPGITIADVAQSDVFRITGTITMSNGQTFTGDNSSATVQGAAFQGAFDVNIPVICPSDLAGTFDYVNTSLTGGGCSGTESVSGTVTWESEASGEYSTTDLSFGMFGECWADDPANSSSARIVDVCNTLSTKGTDQYGDSYTYTITNVSGAVLSLDWVNTFGDAGSVDLTRQDGNPWPPLTN